MPGRLQRLDDLLLLPRSYPSEDGAGFAGFPDIFLRLQRPGVHRFLRPLDSGDLRHAGYRGRIVPAYNLNVDPLLPEIADDVARVGPDFVRQAEKRQHSRDVRQLIPLDQAHALRQHQHPPALPGSLADHFPDFIR